MKELFNKARAGRCFCGRKLEGIRPEQRICGLKTCRRSYLRAYWKDNPRETNLKRTTHLLPSKRGKRWAVVLLECKHRIEIPLYAVRRHKRHRCLKCLA